MSQPHFRPGRSTSLSTGICPVVLYPALAGLDPLPPASDSLLFFFCTTSSQGGGFGWSRYGQRCRFPRLLALQPPLICSQPWCGGSGGGRRGVPSAVGAFISSPSFLPLAVSAGMQHGLSSRVCSFFGQFPQLPRTWQPPMVMCPPLRGLGCYYQM